MSAAAGTAFAVAAFNYAAPASRPMLLKVRSTDMARDSIALWNHRSLLCAWFIVVRMVRNGSHGNTPFLLVLIV